MFAKIKRYISALFNVVVRYEAKMDFVDGKV